MSRTYPAWSAGLLIAGSTTQFAWHFVPVVLQAQVWNASLAILVLVLIGLVANAYRTQLVWRICTVVALWHLMTAGCSIAWLFVRWQTVPGEGQCSTMLNMPLGLVSAWLAGLLAAELGRRK